MTRKILSRAPLEVFGGGMAIYPPGSVLGPLRYSDYEFVWIVEGHVQWTCNGREYAAPPGSFFFMPPRSDEMFVWDPRKQSRHAFVCFRVPRSRQTDFEAPVQVYALPEGDVVRPLFRHLLWLMADHPPGWERAADAAITQMMALYKSGLFSTRHEGLDQNIPAPVVRALHKARDMWARGNLHLPTMQQLAAAAGLSPSQLYRQFMKTYGVAPLTAIRLLRLDHGATLLTTTGEPVKQIALRTGFENQFHFSKAFRQVYECSPREFRGMHARGRSPRPMPALSMVRQLKTGMWSQ
ncbi:MAG: AraC family transcriptional regulator [Verrucomicrobiae bacterium]|nr:AraC family transcriptional regulator [Verrucomicrobiae bacterium]